MIVDAVVLGYLRRGVPREDVGIVSVFGGDGDLFDIQRSDMGLSRRMDI